MFTVGKYIFIKKIGSGAFGEVYLTKKTDSTQLFATKVLSKAKVLQDNLKKYFNNEIFILRNFSHPNIIKLYDLFHSTTKFYLVQDYCNGGSIADCLAKFMKLKGRPFPQSICQYFMRQICAGIRYLHENNIIHRDLKLENILVSYDRKTNRDFDLLKSHIKIIDFGISRFIGKNEVAKSIVGSPGYTEPHILAGMRDGVSDNLAYDQKADIWSLGAICYEMLTGSIPFNGFNAEDILDKINKGKYNLPANITLSKEAISFLNGMLQYDPKKRLTIQQLCDHYFLTKDAHTFEPVKLRNNLLCSIGVDQLRKTLNSNQNLWVFFGVENGNNNILQNIEPNLIENSNKNKIIINLNQPNEAPKDYISLISSLKPSIEQFTKNVNNVVNLTANKNQFLSGKKEQKYKATINNGLGASPVLLPKGILQNEVILNINQRAFHTPIRERSPQPLLSANFNIHNINNQIGTKVIRIDRKLDFNKICIM